MLRSSGQSQEAAQAAREAVQAWRRAIQLAPDTYWYKSALAWLLATLPHPELQRVDEAILLAKKGIELSPQSTNSWRALGVAHYRASHWSDAITALEKSVDIRETVAGKTGDFGFDWIFLAMAHWQLDHKQEARRWYEKAVEWMEKNNPDNEELIRFRQEAEDLLNVADSDQRAESQTEDAPETDEPNNEQRQPSTDQKETTDDE